MNVVTLIGNVTRDPDIRQASTGTLVARFSLALNRGKDRDGNDRGADFPSIVAFGKTAEIIEKYVNKGDPLGVQGRIQTGKYEKEGVTVYTTDVIADRVKLLRSRKEEGGVEGYSVTDEQIPF